MYPAPNTAAKVKLETTLDVSIDSDIMTLLWNLQVTAASNIKGANVLIALLLKKNAGKIAGTCLLANPIAYPAMQPPQPRIAPVPAILSLDLLPLLYFAVALKAMNYKNKGRATFCKTFFSIGINISC